MFYAELRTEVCWWDTDGIPVSATHLSTSPMLRDSVCSLSFFCSVSSLSKLVYIFSTPLPHPAMPCWLLLSVTLAFKFNLAVVPPISSSCLLRTTWLVMHNPGIFFSLSHVCCPVMLFYSGLCSSVLYRRPVPPPSPVANSARERID